MDKLVDVKLLDIDKLTVNGHIYSKEVVEKALAEAKAMIDANNMSVVDLNGNVCGSVLDTRIDGDKLVADVVITTDDAKRKLKESGALRFYSRGTGELDGNKVINYKLDGVGVEINQGGK